MFLRLPLPLRLLVIAALLNDESVAAGGTNTTIDDSDTARIRYTPGWIVSEGSDSRDFGGNHHLSGQSSAEAGFSFVGVAIYFLSPRWPYSVAVQLTLDDEPPCIVDLRDYNLPFNHEGGEETVSSSVVWGQTGLSNGPHSLKIRFPSGFAQYVVVDGLIYTTTDDDESSTTMLTPTPPPQSSITYYYPVPPSPAPFSSYTVQATQSTPSSVPSSNTSQNPSPVVIGAAVGASLAIFGILFALIYVQYRRRILLRFGHLLGIGNHDEENKRQDWLAPQFSMVPPKVPSMRSADFSPRVPYAGFTPLRRTEDDMAGTISIARQHKSLPPVPPPPPTKSPSQSTTYLPLRYPVDGAGSSVRVPPPRTSSRITTNPLKPKKPSTSTTGSSNSSFFPAPVEDDDRRLMRIEPETIRYLPSTIGDARQAGMREASAEIKQSTPVGHGPIRLKSGLAFPPLPPLPPVSQLRNVGGGLSQQYPPNGAAIDAGIRLLPPPPPPPYPLQRSATAPLPKIHSDLSQLSRPIVASSSRPYVPRIHTVPLSIPEWTPPTPETPSTPALRGFSSPNTGPGKGRVLEVIMEVDSDSGRSGMSKRGRSQQLPQSRISPIADGKRKRSRSRQRRQKERQLRKSYQRKATPMGPRPSSRSGSSDGSHSGVSSNRSSQTAFKYPLSGIRNSVSTNASSSDTVSPHTAAAEIGPLFPMPPGHSSIPSRISHNGFQGRPVAIPPPPPSMVPMQPTNISPVKTTPMVSIGNVKHYSRPLPPRPLPSAPAVHPLPPIPHSAPVDTPAMRPEQKMLRRKRPLPLSAGQKPNSPWPSSTGDLPVATPTPDQSTSAAGLSPHLPLLSYSVPTTPPLRTKRDTLRSRSRAPLSSLPTPPASSQEHRAASGMPILRHPLPPVPAISIMVPTRAGSPPDQPLSALTDFTPHAKMRPLGSVSSHTQNSPERRGNKDLRISPTPSPHASSENSCPKTPVSSRLSILIPSSPSTPPPPLPPKQSKRRGGVWDGNNLPNMPKSALWTMD